MLPVEFRPGAVEDLEAALSWYDERSANAGQNLRKEIANAIEAIQANPERWPVHFQGSRSYLLLKFPYSLAYRILVDRIEVLALAHAKRGPGYWKRRLR